MPRPIWKGFITFGLVNIPVVLYSAEKKSTIHFKLLDARDEAKIRYMRVNEETGEEVPWSAVAKGYEYDDHNYIVLKKETIREIAGENEKTITLENFVDKKSLDYLDFDKPYYLVPDKKGNKGYVILREALSETKKVGIAKVMIHTHQYLAALMAYENALVLNLLRYHDALRQPNEFDLPTENLKAYKISKKEMDVAKQLIASMTSKWKPESYHDEFEEALEAYIEEKIHHAKPTKKSKMKTPAAGKSNVVDFVKLLKKSIKDKKGHKKSAVKHSKNAVDKNRKKAK